LFHISQKYCSLWKVPRNFFSCDRSWPFCHADHSGRFDSFLSSSIIQYPCLYKAHAIIETHIAHTLSARKLDPILFMVELIFNQAKADSELRHSSPVCFLYCRFISLRCSSPSALMPSIVGVSHRITRIVPPFSTIVALVCSLFPSFHLSTHQCLVSVYGSILRTVPEGRLKLMKKESWSSKNGNRS
jgi:hypothetical protein